MKMGIKYAIRGAIMGAIIWAINANIANLFFSAETFGGVSRRLSSDTGFALLVGAGVGGVISLIAGLGIKQIGPGRPLPLILGWTAMGAIIGMASPWGFWGFIPGAVIGGFVGGLTDALAATGEFCVIRSPDWILWPLWVLAGALGWAIGLTLIRLLSIPDSNLLFAAVGDMVCGLAIGTLQWLVLRRYVNRAAWWILAWVLGAVVGGTLPDTLVTPDVVYSMELLAVAALIGGLFGLGVGTIQWLFLRQWVRWAILWLPVSIIAVAISDFVRDAVFSTYWYRSSATTYGAVIMSGAIAEAIVGLLLIFLLWLSAPKTAPATT